ncbi:MAG: hypothetical protein Q8P23_00735 [bacterium]|nr:hypothetical protein [bacterium]
MRTPQIECAGDILQAYLLMRTIVEDELVWGDVSLIDDPFRDAVDGLKNALRSCGVQDDGDEKKVIRETIDTLEIVLGTIKSERFSRNREIRPGSIATVRGLSASPWDDVIEKIDQAKLSLRNTFVALDNEIFEPDSTDTFVK